MRASWTHQNGKLFMQRPLTEICSAKHQPDFFWVLTGMMILLRAAFGKFRLLSRGLAKCH
jgi:hypothetical protein